MLNRKAFIGLLALASVAIAPAAKATVYSANTVIMNTGQGGGTDIYFKYLGETSDGYQIWSGNNTADGYAYTCWKIDGGEKISKSISRFEKNTEYELVINYNGWLKWETRYIEEDSKYYHFLKVTSQTTANHFCWDMSSSLDFAKNYYITGSVDATAGDYSLDGSNQCYKQLVSWAVQGMTKDCYSRSVIEYSTDAGTSWEKGATVDSIQGSTYVSIPWTAKKVRYRVTSYPKDYYAVVVQNGHWTYTDSVDHELKPTGISCFLSASDLKSGYGEDESINYRYFQPTVSISCSDNMLAALKNSKVLYSTDGGDTWLSSKEVDYGKGTFKVKVDAGYTKYRFRLLSNPIDDLEPIGGFTAVYDTGIYNVSYSPTIDMVYLEGSVDENRDDAKGTFSPTVGYVLNDDMYQTRRGKAVISVSTDGGNTWTEVGTFTPKSNEGTQQVTIPADMSQYKFRIQATSTTNWYHADQTETTVTCTSANYHYSVPTGIDDASIDGADDTPVDVYTLAGKLVAKQVRPSEVKSLLENGTYVVGNKVVIVK